MIYLLCFAASYLLSLIYVRRFAALRATPLIGKPNGYWVFRPKKLAAIFFLLLVLAPPMLVSAVREGIGTDYYYTYTPRFLEILNGERTYYEIGFYWFNRFIGWFTRDPQWLFIITSFLFCAFVYAACDEEGEDLPYCVLLLLVSGEYFISLNNLRQAVASAVILYAYKYVRREKWLAFAIVVVAMATFHKSMLLFLPIMVLFLLAKRIPLEKLLIAIAIFAVLALALLNAAPELLKMVLPERMVYYINNAMYTQTTIGIPRLLINAVILAFLLYTRFDSNDRELDAFVLVQMLAFVICLFDNLIPAAYRVLRVVTFWQLLAIPKAASKYTDEDRQIIKLSILVALGTLCLYSIVVMGTEEVLPYRSIFHT